MKKRVMFIMPDLNAGGSQRVMLTLAKHLDRTRFLLKVVVIVGERSSVYELPPDIEVNYLKCRRVRSSAFRLLRKVIQFRPDVVFSSLGYINIFLIMMRPLFSKRTRLVVRESSIPSEALEHKPIWRWLYKLFYPNADTIICQSDYMLADLTNILKISRDKLTRVYNPVDIDYINACFSGVRNPYQEYGLGPHIVSAGRLTYVKGFSELIKSFRRLIQIRPSAHLWILGTGELDNDLKALRDSLGLTSSVHFVGLQRNPYQWFKHADLFVLCSRYEGLPNVVMEAIAAGCPVASSVHPGGTREIFELTGQINRFTDEDIWKDHFFARPSPDVINKLKDEFGIRNVVRQFENIFSK